MSLIFKLPSNSGGYCNQLWHLIGYYLKAEKDKKTFILDDSVWNWKNKNGWDDYFESLIIKRKVKSIKEPISKNPLFNNTGYNREELNIFTLSEYKKGFEEIMKLNKELKEKMIKIMKEKGLKKGEFDAIMIRRGSKLFKESKYITTESYINKLVEKGTKKIFIQTDDYNSYEEVKEIIKRKGLEIELYTICPEYKRGGQTAYKRELNKIKENVEKSNEKEYIKEFVKNKKSEEEYTKEEMRIHMEEMIIGLEICILSRYLSTDLQSNITRMLYTRHEKVLTVDNTLKPEFNRKMYNPATNFKYI